MTVKIMTGKQVNFIKELVKQKEIPAEAWALICKEYDIEKEEDLFHLSVEQASSLISGLLKMPGK